MMPSRSMMPRSVAKAEREKKVTRNAIQPRYSRDLCDTWPLLRVIQSSMTRLRRSFLRIGLSQHLRQQLRLDVAAADDHHRLLRFRQLAGVKQPGREGHSPAGFSHDP